MGTPHRCGVFALLSNSGCPDRDMSLTSQNPVQPQAQQTAPFILVVDDSELFRETIQAVLENHGYQTMTANDGGAGLALFREHGKHARAVITDLDMPVLNGLQMLAEIQRLAPEVKVICISGSPAALARVPQAPRRVLALQKTADIGELLASLEVMLRD